MANFKFSIYVDQLPNDMYHIRIWRGKRIVLEKKLYDWKDTVFEIMKYIISRDRD